MTRAEQYIEKCNYKAFGTYSIDTEHAKTACEIAVLEERMNLLISESSHIVNVDEFTADYLADLSESINQLEAAIKAKEEQ